MESVTRQEAATVYAYTNGLPFGYTLTLTNGNTVTRALARDPYRRHLIVSVSNLFNGVFMRGVEYGHDLIGRREGRVDASPAASVTNTFVYNIRAEVTNALFGAYASTYSYDTIGNRVWSVENAVTNTYTANNLNQYAAFTYDADGNMLADGERAYVWNAENRMVVATPLNATNGSERVVSRYDHIGRRVMKRVDVLTGYEPPSGSPPMPGDPGEWVEERTHTFFYDGWNPVLETVVHTNGTVDRIEYVWGLDLSGTLQGAGGVGGLLFEKRNGQIYEGVFFQRAFFSCFLLGSSGYIETYGFRHSLTV
ncbi:MAG: hypothetical protein PHV28_03145 [Kiritimatiellae bacterium]|nr:hypothetical protein [Kiritimatiellia bacterium]